MATAAAQPAYLSGSRRVLAGVVLAVANFMVVLDLAIANVSIPHIAGNLGITLDQGTWIITSYAVSEAICVPLTGWLSQRFGAVRVFVIAMGCFGVFSLLCGMSVTLGMLVICRIGQGMCGAPLMPISQALLLRVFPPEARGVAMAAWSMTVLLAPACGPVLGGVISDEWSWHWIFLINVPIALTCMAAGYLLLRPVETETRNLPIDKIGLALLVFWIGCLQIMLDIGRDHDWFGDPLIVALAVMAVIGFAVFVIWELTEEHPIVDLRIFANRGFSASVACLALSYSAYFAGTVIIPQWLQTSMGYSAMLAGVVTAVGAVSAMTTSQLVGRLVGKVDARLLVSAGLTWSAGAILLRTGWDSGADFWTLAMPQIVMGLGLPFFFVPLNLLTLGVVRPDQVPAAAGLQNFVRTMAVAISTSIALTVLGNRERVMENELVSKLRPDETVASLEQAGFTLEQSRQYIAALVEREALMASVINVFYIASILTVCAAAILWLSPRPSRVSTKLSGH